MSKIYPNREAAEKACKDYIDAVDAALEKFGVCEYCEDALAEMIIRAEYYDSDGNIQKYYH